MTSTDPFHGFENSVSAKQNLFFLPFVGARFAFLLPLSFRRVKTEGKPPEAHCYRGNVLSLYGFDEEFVWLTSDNSTE